MPHRSTTEFWRHYDALSREVRARADKQFSLLKANSQHPSLQFKKVGERHGQEIWSARVTSQSSRACNQAGRWIFVVMDWRSQELRSDDFLMPPTVGRSSVEARTCVEVKELS
jgi:hypothetical protein